MFFETKISVPSFSGFYLEQVNGGKGSDFL